MMTYDLTDRRCDLESHAPGSEECRHARSKRSRTKLDNNVRALATQPRRKRGHMATRRSSRHRSKPKPRATPRTATAIAKTACKLAVIPEKRFLFMVQTTPHFALQIMKVMADRLRKMNERV